MKKVYTVQKCDQLNGKLSEVVKEYTDYTPSCKQLMTFTNILDPDEAPHFVLTLRLLVKIKFGWKQLSFSNFEPKDRYS